MISIFLFFAILIFYLAICNAVSTGLIVLLLFSKNKNYFLNIFKPGLIVGSIGILLIFVLSYFFNTEIDQMAEPTWVLIIPVIIMLGGNIFQTVRIYRREKR